MKWKRIERRVVSPVIIWAPAHDTFIDFRLESVRECGPYTLYIGNAYYGLLMGKLPSAKRTAVKAFRNRLLEALELVGDPREVAAKARQRYLRAAMSEQLAKEADFSLRPDM